MLKFYDLLLNSNSMTVLSQAASKANCPRRSVDSTRHGQNEQHNTVKRVYTRTNHCLQVLWSWGRGLN